MAAASSGPDGTLRYGYNRLGRLASVTDTAGGIFGIGYDPSSRPVSLTRPNLVNDQFNYDSLGNLTSRNSSAGSTEVGSSTYSHDGNGQATWSTGSSGTSTYTYDPLGQLLQVGASPGGSSRFTYDSVGNRLTGPGPASGQSTHDAGSRLLSDGQFTNTYDNEGRLTGKVARSSGAKTTYAWDGYGQLKSIRFPDGSTST